MTNDEEQTIKETKQHINNVKKFLIIFLNELTNRALIHDQSKLEDPELKTFVEYTPKLKSSTYGSEEYKNFLKEMKPALDHHYAHNSHHPEHYENGIDGMDLMDLVEMLADWKAASMRHDDGDINKSIEINSKRFNMSPQLVNIYKNTVERYFK